MAAQRSRQRATRGEGAATGCNASGNARSERRRGDRRCGRVWEPRNLSRLYGPPMRPSSCSGVVGEVAGGHDARGVGPPPARILLLEAVKGDGMRQVVIELCRAFADLIQAAPCEAERTARKMAADLERRAGWNAGTAPAA